MKGNPTRNPIETARLKDLVAYIEVSHHAFTRDQLGRIAGLVTTLDEAGRPVPDELRHVCDELAADLLPHLMKEESILFPYIVALESSPSPPHACFGTLANPIRMMNIEHDRLDGVLTRLRALTDHYRTDSSLADGVVALYAALEALDADLVQHMYLEDDVLFPRAQQLESEVLT